MDNKRCSAEAGRTIEGRGGNGQLQRAIRGKVCVCLSKKPTLQTDAFRKNPNIFVRTLSDNRETPLSIFFRQLITFDSFEEEAQL